MFVSLFKKNKFIILFLYLFFSCLSTISLKANPTFVDGTVVDDQGGDPNTAQERFTTGLSFNNNGTKMFITGTENASANEFTLSTAFDISTRSFVDAFDISGTGANEDGAPTSVKFNDDGTKMFTAGFKQFIKEFSLSTAFDVSTSTFEQIKDLSTELTLNKPKDIEFNADGTKMFILETSSIYVYTLSTAFDISTASYDNYAFSTADYETSLTGFDFNDDGTVMFILGTQNDKVHEYYLSTGFDLTTASHVSSFSINGKDVQPKGMAFNNTGSKMFFLGNENDSVYEYTLVSNYNLKLPTLSSSSPADNATGVSVDANIVLNFSEKVNVDNGNITIHKTSDDSTVATINVTSSNVTAVSYTHLTLPTTPYV